MLELHFVLVEPEICNSFLTIGWSLLIVRFHVEVLCVAGDQTKEMTPKQDALEHICSGKDKAFLKETFVNSSKG